MLTLAAFPNEYNLNIQQRIIERLGARAAQLVYQQYFTVDTTDQYQLTTEKLGSLGAMGTWNDGAEVPTDEPQGQGTLLFTQAFYGQGFKVSRKLVQYNRLGIVNRLAMALADSAIQTIRANHALVLNNAFATTTWRDGQVLVCATHPTAGGGTRSNILAAATALSHQSLEAMRIVATAHVDYRGKKDPRNIDQLVVPSALETTAREITGSPKKPYTTDNEINVFLGTGVVPEDHLTSATAWFGRDSSSYNLLSLWGLMPRMGQFIDQWSQSLVHFLEMDFTYGADDFEGIFGSAGTA